MEDEKNNEEKHYMHFLHTPKFYCRHIKSSLNMPDNNINVFPDISLNSLSQCDSNGCNEKENWICLKCYKIFCGRFGNKHMIKHYEQDTNKTHCIALGILDLSFWCYSCDDYLHHLAIHKIFEMYKIAHLKKFGIDVPKKIKSKNNPYADNDNNDYEFDPEQVKKWRYGEQIRHSMECESSMQGHPQGVILFIKLLNQFREKHIKQVKMNDINVILEIIVTFDRHDLLKLLINHPYLSIFLKTYTNTDNDDDADDDDNILVKTVKTQKKRPSKLLQSSLKKSIRSGNLKVLNYLITQNVINIQLFNNKQIQSKEYENNLKSLLFTILRGIEIGSKKHSTKYKSNCFAAAKLFWPYLCKNVCDLKQNKHAKDTDTDTDALQQLIINSDNSLKDDTNNSLVKNLKSMNDDYLTIKYISLFMPSMIKQRMKYVQYMAIFDVLKFLRERYITFNTRKTTNNIKNGWISICNELIMNYSDKIDKNNNINNCLELEMIDYLISGGMDINIINNKIKKNDDEHLNETIKKGTNNWNIKNWKLDKIKEIMPSTVPIEINLLIIYMLCL